MNSSNEVGTAQKDLRDYAWNYFQLHANQRLAAFNFYIALSTVVSTGLFASFHKDFGAPSLTIILGSLLIGLSFVFWRLDGRNKELLHHAEEALKAFEASIAEDSVTSTEAKVFTNEAKATTEIKARRKGLRKLNPYTVSNCFRTVFGLFTLIGVFGVVAAVLELG
jgi:hypothetical protein